MSEQEGARLSAPATVRNREPIYQVLSRVLPKAGTVLEVAAGTGEHAVYLAPRLAPRLWLPSDTDGQMLASIAAWAADEPCETLLPAIALDASDDPWPVEAGQDPGPPDAAINAIVNINMIHIAPWAACTGLMAGAGRILPPGGILYLYGPYMRAGAHTAPSNEMFDESLRAQNMEWGLREVEQVIEEAKKNALGFMEAAAMPANNFSLVFEKR